MDIKNIDIFSPLIVIAVIIFYVLFAAIGTEYNMMGLSPVSAITYIYIFYGSLIFILGISVAYLIEKRVTGKFFDGKKARDSLRTFLDYMANHKYFTERRVLFWVLFPLALQFINLYLMGGIPLFSGYLKEGAFNSITVISYTLFLLAITTLMVKYYRRSYFILVLIGVIVFAATGYRATGIGIILSVMIGVFYTNGNRFKYFLILTPAIIIAGLIIGYLAATSIEWQHWNVNPLSLVFIRAGYTLTILDKIVHMQSSGHGLITYNVLTGFMKSVDPRLVLGEFVLKYYTSITSTIFGPAILDFGYLGLGVQMFFLGLVLKLLHGLQNIKSGLYTVFYAIGLSHTIIWVETSPMDLAVWIYYLVAVVVIITALISLKVASDSAEHNNQMQSGGLNLSNQEEEIK